MQKTTVCCSFLMTPDTKKCFSLLCGITAVHLLNNNFSGFIGLFDGLVMVGCSLG